MRVPALFPILLLALGAAAAPAQTTGVRIDFGSTTWPTGVQGGVTWNDVDDTNQGQVHDLADTAGAATGWQLAFTPGALFDGANNNGVVTPAPGSDLEGLGWPSSALRDSLWAAGGEVEFTLTGLDPAATYDLTIVASRMGVGDVRTTAYRVSGAVVVEAVLDAANNDAEIVVVRGVRPDATGAIAVRLRADRTNTNASRFFYLNALGMDAWAPGTQGALVGFTRNRLDFSRLVGKGAYATSLDLYTNDGTAPAVTLTALDDATGLPPAWLTVPGSATPGATFPVTVDGSGFGGPGVASATITAQAGGYAGDAFRANLTVRPSGAWNLLFYGNSYSIMNGTVPAIVADIATAAGQPTPNVVAKLVGGKDLAFHRYDPDQAAAITDALLLGEEWDFVVMQGYSLEATTPLGNPAAFQANAMGIARNVRAHSPAAGVAMYQTWARGQGHAYYGGANPVFSGPMEMHRQVETQYQAAVDAMNAAFGAGTAWRAAAGETMALHGWDPALYTADLSHPVPAVSLMAAMTIYTALYGADAGDLRVDVPGSGALGAWLGAYGLDAADWTRLAGIADRVRIAGQRRQPGSTDDLLLLSGAGGPRTARTLEVADRGDRIALSLDSPGGSLRGLPFLLFVDAFPTGSPSGPNPLFPEIRIAVGRARLLAHGASLPAAGLDLVLGPALVPPGTSLLFQGFALGPGRWTGNPQFVTTDGHEVQVR